MIDTATTIRSVQCRNELKAIREEYGYGIFDQAMREINRERLQIGSAARDSRKRFKNSLYKNLYRRQRGICPLCSLAMVMPNHFPGGLEVDHIDPNRKDFNDPGNLSLAHAECNRKKGAKSIQELSKLNGRTFKEIVQVPVDEDCESTEEPLPTFIRKLMD